MDALAAGRGGSTMPTRASSSRSVHQLQQVAVGVEGGGVEVPAAGGDDPQALLAQPLVLRQVPLGDVGVDGHPAGVGVEHGPGAGEQLVGGAFDEAAHHVPPGAVGHPVEGGHQFVVGVEGQFGDPRVGLPGRDGVDSALRGQCDERTLGGVADQLTVADDGVGGQHHRQQELVQVDDRLPGDAGDVARAGVAGAVDGVAAAHHRHLHGGHLVQGQRPGLVRVDRRGRAEGFGGLHPFHDRAGLGQGLGAVGQDRGDHRRQVLRQRADRERDRRGEHHGELGTAGQVQRHRHHQGDPGDPQDLPGQPGQLPGQWRCRFVLRGEQPGDLADLGAHPDPGDHELPGTAGDIGVHVHHVGSVAQRCVRLRHRVDALGDGQAFPGERRLGHLQGGHPQQPAVRRHKVAGLDRHHITGHELLGGELPQFAVPQHPGGDDHHPLQRGHRGDRLALLTQTQHRVEQGERDQHDTGLQLLERVETHGAGDQQHDLHRVRVLPHERPPPGFHPRRREPVRTEPLRPGRRLPRAQACPAVHPLHPQHLFDGHRVPRPGPPTRPASGSASRTKHSCGLPAIPSRSIANDRHRNDVAAPKSVVRQPLPSPSGGFTTHGPQPRVARGVLLIPPGQVERHPPGQVVRCEFPRRRECGWQGRSGSGQFPARTPSRRRRTRRPR